MILKTESFAAENILTLTVSLEGENIFRSLFKTKKDKMTAPFIWASIFSQFHEQMKEEFMFIVDVSPIHSVRSEGDFNDDLKKIKNKYGLAAYYNENKSSENKTKQLTFVLDDIEDITEFIHWYYDNHNLRFLMIEKDNFHLKRFHDIVEKLNDMEIDFNQLSEHISMLINFEFSGRSIHVVSKNTMAGEDLLNRLKLIISELNI